jgi:hypothetical protein
MPTITITPEQQSAYAAGEPITLVPPRPRETVKVYDLICVSQDGRYVYDVTGAILRERDNRYLIGASHGPAAANGRYTIIKAPSGGGLRVGQTGTMAGFGGSCIVYATREVEV